MKAISTLKAPKAIGPYSQAIQASGFLFVSGQIPINPETGKIEAISIEDQTKQVLSNLLAILEEAGVKKTNVVSCEIFLANIQDFSVVNILYGEFFESCEIKPARKTIQAAALPMGSKVEIALIATAE